MSIGFLMDVHVDVAVTRGLRSRGIDAITAQEDGSARRDDPDFLDRAGSLGRVVFTQDDDFLREAHRRQSCGEFFAGVVYVKQNKISIGRMIQDLELIAKVLDAASMANRVEYLPL